jgi:hypothetical protein
MLTATVVGVFFIPLFFAVIRSLAERRTAAAPGSAPALGTAHGD